ncbi:MAG TPA: hypothetical protein VKA21_14275, partial [Candidatus Binatia bacterium]|nr:hypothetical protein [Candidatus Binatia bacterium]
MSRSTRALVACLAVAAALRVGRLAERPFLHSDAPAYIEIAAALGEAPWTAAFTAYHPPGFPLALRLAHELGFDWEAAGRAV